MTFSHDVTRRSFLASSALTLAGIGMGAGRADALTVAIPTTRAARRLSPSAFLPDPTPADVLRRFAVMAMDAAKSAGADFADIRIGMRRGVSVALFPYPPGASLLRGYGVRARVNGTWGFQHGTTFSADAIVTAARSAVAGAKRYAAVNQRLGHHRVVELAPAPVVTGEWSGPNEIDPFSVPLDDYYRAIQTLINTAIPAYRNVSLAGGTLGWNAETRVFASTEESLVTQHFMKGGTSMLGRVTRPDTGEFAGFSIVGLEKRSAGFEIVLDDDLLTPLRNSVEEARRITELPMRPFTDVGRFPVVFSGDAYSNLFGRTASQAVAADRVSGAEADASGDTFLVPVDTILGASEPQFSPLLTARVDRVLPYLDATGWDDEGVAPEPYTIVERGHVVDYHTVRDNAPLFAKWYAKQGRPLRAHGGAVARYPGDLPACIPGHVHVAPSEKQVSVSDLASDIKRGFIFQDPNAGVEPGLSLAAAGGVALEVRQGKVVSRTPIYLRIPVKKFLSTNLLAIGGSETVRTTMVTINRGVPPKEFDYPVTAPAVLCKDIDVTGFPNG